MKKLLGVLASVAVLLSILGCKQNAGDPGDFRGNYKNVVAAFTYEESENSLYGIYFYKNGTFKTYYKANDIADVMEIKSENDSVAVGIILSFLVTNSGTYEGNPLTDETIVTTYNKKVSVDAFDELVDKKTYNLAKGFLGEENKDKAIKYIKKNGKKNEDGVYVFYAYINSNELEYITLDEPKSYKGTVDLEKATLTTATEFCGTQTFHQEYPDY